MKLKTVLQSLMLREPELNEFGFGLYDGDRHKPTDEQDAITMQNRQRLLSSVHRIHATCEWIETHLQPIKTINPNRSSYGLKHCAEKDIGYITNGVFIAAMLIRGYRYQRSGPNAKFNVSERSIRQAHAQHNHVGHRVCI